MSISDTQQRLALEALQEAIEIAGNQSALAEALDVTRQAVSAWVTGAKGISPAMAVEIERATGVQRERLVPALFVGLRVYRPMSREPA